MNPNKILTVFKTSCIGPLLSLLTVVLLEVFARTLYPIPNPPAILLITVVYSAFCGGVRSGLLSATIAWLYFAWFFSIPGEPFHCTHENLLRILVWAVATPLIAVMTGLLKQHSQYAFELERANAILEARIAEREQSERVLRDKESLLQTVLEILPVGVWLIDAKGLITHGNQAGQRIWAGRRYVGIEQYHEYKGWWAGTGKRIDAEEWAAARAIMRGETSLEEVVNIECFDGSHKTILSSAVPIRDTAQNIIGAIAVNQDITERRQTEERLAYLASYDTLTDLPNRTLFSDRLTQAMARTDRNESILALLLLDMDRFKEINDMFGHNVGDLLLRAVAYRLQQGLREVDTIARLGGDEFTMVLENIGAAETAAAVARKVVDVFTQPFILNEREMFITPSIGIALYPRDAQDANTLLRNADIAMYHAKRKGGGNFQFYTEQMHTQTTHQSDLETGLHSALAQGEFTLHYQPQIEIKSGRIVGLEALIRWHNDVLGTVTPDQFIPLAEGIGLIEPIGEWVLHTACAQNKAWQEAGLTPLQVAVNLSARQFRQKDLLGTILRILQDTGLDPCYLELEITESVIMSRSEQAISTLKRLSALGVQISIDDFGSGYSSLAYLKRFAVDRLKINQSFVRDISADPDDMAIVTAIIAMARSLQLKVTAEGVETEDQLSLLGSLNCDDYQGYYFSHPIPADEMEKLLRTQARL